MNIIYNNECIATLGQQDTIIINCANKGMWTPIELCPQEDEPISPEIDITITYNDKTTVINSDGTYRLECLYNKMYTDIVISSKITQLKAPTVEKGDESFTIKVTNPEGNPPISSYNLYSEEGECIKSIPYESNPQIIKVDVAGYYQVSAVDSSGNESALSEKVEADSCFAAGTPVLMNDGSLRVIEDIKVGDKVQSFDLDSQQYVEGTVCHIIQGKANKLAMMLFDDNSYVVVSENHCMYVNNEWRSPSGHNGNPKLSVGDKVLNAYGYSTLLEINIIEVDSVDVYGLCVSLNNKEHEVKEGIYFAGPSLILAVHGGGSN